MFRLLQAYGAVDAAARCPAFLAWRAVPVARVYCPNAVCCVTTGLDLFGYFYVNGKYFHVSNLGNWREVSKPVRGSTAKHKGKAHPVFFFNEGKCEVCSFTASTACDSICNVQHALRRSCSWGYDKCMRVSVCR